MMQPLTNLPACHLLSPAGCLQVLVVPRDCAAADAPVHTRTTIPAVPFSPLVAGSRLPAHGAVGSGGLRRFRRAQDTRAAAPDLGAHVGCLDQSAGGPFDTRFTQRVRGTEEMLNPVQSIPACRISSVPRAIHVRFKTAIVFCRSNTAAVASSLVVPTDASQSAQLTSQL